MSKYIIIAGSDGSGKTTLYHTLDYLKELPRISIDDVTEEVGSISRASDKMKAVKIVSDRINALLENNTSFVQEASLCGLGVIDNLLKAKAHHYELEMYYVGISSIEIVQNRLKDKPVKSIDFMQKRYLESISRLHDLIPLIDTVYIYDNTNQLELISEYQSGKLIKQTSQLPDWLEASLL